MCGVVTAPVVLPVLKPERLESYMHAIHLKPVLMERHREPRILGARIIQATEPEHREVEEPAAAGMYRVGMRVVHPMFGVGTVRMCDRSGKDEKLVVHFQRAGVKKLVARFARLEIV